MTELAEIRPRFVRVQDAALQFLQRTIAAREISELATSDETWKRLTDAMERLGENITEVDSYLTKLNNLYKQDQPLKESTVKRRARETKAKMKKKEPNHGRGNQ